MKDTKTKIIRVILIIVMLLSAIIMHELMYAAAKLIPFPVALGMIGGFALGYLYTSAAE
jgi:hypothetical protein